MPIFCLTGTVVFNAGPVNSAALLAHFADRLRDDGATDVRVEDNRVSFTGGIFRFAANWTALLPFGSGEITVDAEGRELRYRLSYRQQIILFGILILAAEGVLLALRIPTSSGLYFDPIPVCLVTIVGNVGVGSVRFRDFLRRSLASVPIAGS